MKYRTYFSIRFYNNTLPQEDHICKSIKQALQLLREIDEKKSKCKAMVTIFKGE